MNGFSDHAVITDDTRPIGPLFYPAPKHVSCDVTIPFEIGIQPFILPYETIDSNLVFHNKQSWGFGVQLLLDKHRHTHLVAILLKILKSLPPHIDCTIILHKHRHIETVIQHATYSVFNLLEDASYLHNHQCYLFLSTRCSERTLITQRQHLEKQLQLAKHPYCRLDKPSFLMLIQAWLAHLPQSTQWPTLVDIDAGEKLALMQPLQTRYTENDNHIQVDCRDPFQQSHTFHVVNAQLKPQINNPLSHDKPALIRPETLIPCSFRFSITIRKTPHNDAYEVFHNLSLITNETQQNQHVQQTTALYKTNNYQLQTSFMQQSLSFFAGLPFCITDGLYEAVVQNRLMSILSLQETENLLPIASDTKGSSHGILLPTYTGQIAFFNLFDKQYFPNQRYYYRLITDSQTQRLAFQTALISSGLNLMEKIYVLGKKNMFKGPNQSYLDANDVCQQPHLLDATKPFTFLCISQLVHQHDFYKMIHILIKHGQRLSNKSKIHIMILWPSQMQHHTDILVEQLQSLFQKSQYPNLRVGFVTPTCLNPNTIYEKMLSSICELKIVVGQSSIESYISMSKTLEEDLSLTKFDERQMPSYHDVLLHTPNTYSFHRFKYRRA